MGWLIGVSASHSIPGAAIPGSQFLAAERPMQAVLLRSMEYFQSGCHFFFFIQDNFLAKSEQGGVLEAVSQEWPPTVLSIYR